MTAKKKLQSKIWRGSATIKGQYNSERHENNNTK
jgi:hypothetical protein